MKKIISIFLIIITSFIMLTTTIQVFAEKADTLSDITTETGKIYIPFEKKWENTPDDVKPQSVTIKLYKYLGEEFDINSAILLESAEVSSSNSWKYNFDISDVELFDSQNNAYKFKVVEEIINGYQEVAHQDPNVIFTPPSASNDWKRETINSTTIFKIEEGVGQAIVASMTGNQGGMTVIWTVDALSESERVMIYESVINSNQLPGSFKNSSYEDFIFISGTVGTFVNKGEVVIEATSTQIQFLGGTKVWSQFAMGVYSKSSTETNASYITNTIKRVDLSVEKVWEDHNNILELRPHEITVQLIKNKVVIDSVKLSDSNSWKHIFTGLYEYENGIKNEYEIKELDIAGYVSSSKVEGNRIIITNKREVEATRVTVNKIWNNVDQIDHLPGVIVALYYKKNANDQFVEINRVTLNENNNWQYTFVNGVYATTGKVFDILPAEYIYEVREIGLEIDESEADFYRDFFITEHANTGNNWTITNTCTASYVLPETGNSGGLILTIVAFLLLGTPIVYIIYPFVIRAYKLVSLK